MEHGLFPSAVFVWMCSELTAFHADMHDGDQKTFARESHSHGFCSRARRGQVAQKEKIVHLRSFETTDDLRMDSGVDWSHTFPIF